MNSSLAVEPIRAVERWNRRPRVPEIGLLVVFTLIYFGALFSAPLLDDADATHAEAAREMLVRGDYVTLHVNGVRYLEKAPLPYWLVAFSYRIFGVNEFATHLPIALAVLLLGWLAFAWGRRASGERAGIYAGLFVFTAAGVYLFTRIMIPEAILSLLIAGSFYFFSSALEGEGAWCWFAGYASVALAVLTKGLVALVFVAVPAAGYLLLTGEWRRWREFRLLSGLALLFTIAAPWHIIAGIRNPRFFWFYFVNEHFLRFLGKRYPADYNKLPASLYWVLHLVWLFPWSLYLPVLVANARRDLRVGRTGLGRGGQDALRTAGGTPALRSETPSLLSIDKAAELRSADFAARTRLLCWIWAGVVLLFFAFSTNQEYYTFPAYFPFLLLVADAISKGEEEGSRWLTICTMGLAVITTAASGALIAGLWQSRHLPYVADIGQVLSHNMAEDTLSMSHALDLSAASFAALRLPAILAALALLTAPLAALVLRLRRKHYAATWTIAGGMAVLLVAAHLAFIRFGTYLSSKTLAQDIAAQARPEDRIMIYGDQAYGSSLLFYLRRPIELVNGRTTSMWFGSTYPDAPKIYLDDKRLLQAWKGGGRVFLFVPAYEKSRVDALLPQKYVFAERSGKFVYSNQPSATSESGGAERGTSQMMVPPAWKR